MLDQIISAVGAGNEEGVPPLLGARPPKKVEIVVLTSDRGLAGGFNSNVLRRASRFIHDQQQTYSQIEISTIGRKAYDFFRRRKLPVRKDFAGLYSQLSYRAAADIAAEFAAHFIAGEVDSVFLLYNEFVSAISQRITIVQLLPVLPPARAVAGIAPVDSKYEPDMAGVPAKILPPALASD